MSIKIFSDETIIELIIASSKELLNDRFFGGNYTVFSAFEETTAGIYYYGQAHKFIASNVDLNRFKASVYSYLRHGIDLRHSVRLSASSFYNNTRRNHEHDQIFIEKLLDAEAARTEAIRKNEKEAEAIRKILRHQTIEHIDKIQPLIIYEKNHGGIGILTYVSLFNYGYILGKRAERARRKGGASNV